MSRSKLDHLRAKEEKVYFGENEFTVRPKTNRELLAIADVFKKEWNEIVEEDMNLTLDNIIMLIKQKPAKLINELVEEDFSKDDFLDAFPDDVFDTLSAFREANFTFLSRLNGLKNLASLLTGNSNQSQMLDNLNQKKSN